jgi:iron-sulfur cluster assembly protein
MTVAAEADVPHLQNPVANPTSPRLGVNPNTPILLGSPWPPFNNNGLQMNASLAQGLRFSVHRHPTTRQESEMITLTPSALSAIDKFIKGAATPVAGLRIAVSGGGCSGFQYGMKLEEAKAEDDVVVEMDGVTLLVDVFSAPLLAGVTVDFVDSLNGSGFKFVNPNATSSCACGSSFSA